uniref:DNA polymerase delta subunit OB-fold domain-containing protein n=1 Tax=Panagrolaimus davidi TaxID=227884 RepID=A0A914QKZ0_9BILA
MDLPTIIKRFKKDLNIVKNDYANVPYIFKEEYSNYKNGELEMENGTQPNFQCQICAARYLIKNPKEANYCDPKRCAFYQTRIKHMYSRIVENAKKLLDDDGIEAVNLEDVNPEEKCFVVGCLMKNGEHSTTGIEDF